MAVISVISIAGMITSAVLGHIGGVVGFGLPSSIAILVLIGATAVLQARPGGGNGTGNGENSLDRESLGREVENQIRTLATGGTDEEALRNLVRSSTALGQSLK